MLKKASHLFYSYSSVFFALFCCVFPTPSEKVLRKLFLVPLLEGQLFGIQLFNSPSIKVANTVVMYYIPYKYIKGIILFTSFYIIDIKY